MALRVTKDGMNTLFGNAFKAQTPEEQQGVAERNAGDPALPGNPNAAAQASLNPLSLPEAEGGMPVLTVRGLSSPPVKPEVVMATPARDIVADITPEFERIVRKNTNISTTSLNLRALSIGEIQDIELHLSTADRSSVPTPEGHQFPLLTLALAAERREKELDPHTPSSEVKDPQIHAQRVEEERVAAENHQKKQQEFAEKTFPGLMQAAYLLSGVHVAMDVPMTGEGAQWGFPAVSGYAGQFRSSGIGIA